MAPQLFGRGAIAATVLACMINHHHPDEMSIYIEQKALHHLSLDAIHANDDKVHGNLTPSW